ncbi:MAG: hypothetical protein AAGF95_07420 [Chloroflexota bacterium]
MHCILSRTSAMLITFSILMTACTQPQVREVAPTQPTTVAPTVQPTVSAETDPHEEIKAGIQETLDRYTQALNEGDIDLAEQLVAPGSGPLRREFLNTFEGYIGAFESDYVFDHTVHEVSLREHGFVQAHITVETGSAADWLFREVDGEWLFSEPGEDLLGEREIIEHEHFTFYRYPWSDITNETLLDMMEEARRVVGERLGQLSDEKLDVHIRPVTGFPLLRDGGSAKGYYYPADSEFESDHIVVHAPYSFGFGLYDPDGGWEDSLQHVITHEYVHFATTQAFMPLSDMNPWMSEGLAEYIAEAQYDDVLQDVANEDLFIPIIDTTRAYGKQDLEHLNLGLEDEYGVDYALAYSLVVYITETYGGLDGFWAMVEAYEPKRDFDAALQEAFGVDYATFEQEWQDWVIERYGS